MKKAVAAEKAKNLVHNSMDNKPIKASNLTTSER